MTVAAFVSFSDSLTVAAYDLFTDFFIAGFETLVADLATDDLATGAFAAVDFATDAFVLSADFTSVFPDTVIPIAAFLCSDISLKLTFAPAVPANRFAPAVPANRFAPAGPVCVSSITAWCMAAPSGNPSPFPFQVVTPRYKSARLTRTNIPVTVFLVVILLRNAHIPSTSNP